MPHRAITIMITIIIMFIGIVVLIHIIIIVSFEGLWDSTSSSTSEAL